MTRTLAPELTAMAAELALGVLEGAERAEALRLVIADPDFAAEVKEWQDCLDPLGEDFAEVPPPNVWSAIEAKLDSEPKTAELAAVRFWRTTAALTTALAACLAGVVLFNSGALSQAEPSPAAVPARVAIAQLAGADGTLLAARLDSASGQITIRPMSLPETSLVPELWIIPDDGVPRSLGLISANGITDVTLSARLRPLVVEGAILAVSLETPQGAPHTAPSSTPIATGKISVI